MKYTTKINLLIRVVRRRIRDSEDIETVLQSYPKLSVKELEIVRKAVQQVEITGKKYADDK